MGKKVNNHHLASNFAPLWTNLSNKYNLSERQTEQLQEYMNLLIEWNEKFNLTAITNPQAIIESHFDDSLALAQHIDLTSVQTVADVGTGAGFPGIPLKILYPHLNVILIEVNNKKRSFLAHVAQQLGLSNITLCADEWRTFLRSTDQIIQYFFARASLQPEELIRIFKPSCAYKNATMIYWASAQWQAGKIEANFVEKEIVYTLDTVQRKFVCFKKQNFK